tara:strand:+ start:240 stop:1223 length:984 start_codon:yes stop_codon:yes gene_type:complete
MNNLLEINPDETDPSFGFKPDERPLSALMDYGLIKLDKPEGPTSHEVVSWVRKLLNIQKAGHSGTLDPLVTGLLPIGIGEGTKVLSVLLHGPKEYQALARLHDPVDESQLSKVLHEFTGELYQKPPQRSAVKRQTRTRKIYKLELVEKVGRLLVFNVLCQAGTYVRKLCYDIGEVLGPGLTMFELRRTKVCHIQESDGLIRLHDIVYALDQLKSGNESEIRKCILPIEHVVSWIKAVYVRDSAVDAICHGAQLAIPGISKLSKDISVHDLVAMYTLKGEIIAIGEASLSSNDISNNEKGLALSTMRVIMKPGTYGRLWKKTAKRDNT